MLYSEIIAVCSQIHTKHINAVCGQNVELLDVRLSGTYSNHQAVKDYHLENCSKSSVNFSLSLSPTLFLDNHSASYGLDARAARGRPDSSHSSWLYQTHFNLAPLAAAIRIKKGILSALEFSRHSEIWWTIFELWPALRKLFDNTICWEIHKT